MPDTCVLEQPPVLLGGFPATRLAELAAGLEVLPLAVTAHGCTQQDNPHGQRACL